MTLAGIVRRVRFEQAANASDPMFVTLLPMITLVRLVHLENAPALPPYRPFPIWVTLSGIVTLVRAVQFQNAPDPMLMTPLPIVALARFVQYSNTRSPMIVTLLGM